MGSFSYLAAWRNWENLEEFFNPCQLFQEVHIVAMDDDYEYESVRFGTLTIHPVPSGRVQSPLLRNLDVMWRSIRCLSRLLYSMPVDLVAQIYGGPLKFGLPAVVAARSAKVPCTVITHALSSSITWLGERKDIRCILAATDVFTLPTFYREGIPRVLLEAASMSLPLVATQRPGCEDVIPEGTNGFLVPARDSAALAEAILKLVRDSHLRERFARESRRIAVTRFDLQGIARRTARLYEGLLRKRVRMDLSGRVHPAVREDANDSEYPSVRARSGREQQRDKHSRATTTPV